MYLLFQHHFHPSQIQVNNLRDGGGDLLDSDRALTEVVLELAVYVTEMAHAAGSRSASSLRLHAPVEGALAGRRVSAGGAARLLDVVATTPAADA